MNQQNQYSHLKTSLAMGLFGQETQTTESATTAENTQDKSGLWSSIREAAKGRVATATAMVALAVGGLTPTLAAETTPPNDKDGGNVVPPTSDPKNAAVEGQGGPAQEVHKFDIPAGTLNDVVTSIRKQAGIRITLASVDKMGDVASPGVQGVLTVREALEHALDTTGFAARFDTPTSVTIDIRSANESIVVTADGAPTNLKYTAPLVDLPQTVTVIGEETIQNTASTTLMEALRTVPGITFGAGEGGNPLGDRPFIRGLDSQSSTYIDGIRDIAAQTRETFDIDSIEVQEGPGGAYGGRGTGGGSININSKIARKDHFIAGSFTPGTSSYKRFTVDANSRLNSFTYGRLTGLWHDAGVAGRDGVHNARWGFAPSLAMGLGHPTRLFVDYYHLVQNNIPDSGIPYNNPSLTAASAVADSKVLKQILTPGDGEPIALPYRTIYYGLLDRDKDNEYAKVATGRVERDLFNEHALLRNTFRYERTSQDYIWTLPDDSQGNLYYGVLFRRINSKYNSVYTDDNQTDLSGTFKTGSVKHSYATGMEFSKERGNVDSYANNTTRFSVTPTQTTAIEDCILGSGAATAYNCTSLFSPNDRDPWVGASATPTSGATVANSVALAHNPAHSVAVTKSVYGFDTINLSKHFLATVGGRFDRFDSTYRPAVSATAIAPQSVSNNLGTYIAGLTYKPDNATSIYGTISTAAIPTGNSLAQGTDVSALSTVGNGNLLPETIRQEEFGVKRELAGGKALAHLAVYREDIQNVRIAIDAAGDVANAGTDRTIGLEAGLSGRITRKWDATGGYSFIDARLTATAYTAAAGLGATNGTFMPNTPWSSFSMTSNYEIMHGFKIGGGLYANSMVWGNQSTNKWVKGYVREDLFGSYQLNKHAFIQGNVLNLSDKVYYQQAYATHYAILAPGRTIELGINFKF